MDWEQKVAFPESGQGREGTSAQCLQLPLLFDTLQAPPQKTDFHRLATRLTLQFGGPALLDPLATFARKWLRCVFPEQVAQTAGFAVCGFSPGVDQIRLFGWEGILTRSMVEPQRWF